MSVGCCHVWISVSFHLECSQKSSGLTDSIRVEELGRTLLQHKGGIFSRLGSTYA